MNERTHNRICRTIGCTGPFARWFRWPARLCGRITLRRHKQFIRKWVRR